MYNREDEGEKKKNKGGKKKKKKETKEATVYSFISLFLACWPTFHFGVSVIFAE